MIDISAIAMIPTFLVRCNKNVTGSQCMDSDFNTNLNSQNRTRNDFYQKKKCHVLFKNSIHCQIPVTLLNI